MTIPREAVTSKVTSIRIEGVEGAGTQDAPLDPSAAHLVVRAEAMSQGTVVIDHVGHAALTETVEVVAEDGAHLTVVSVHDWAEGSVHAASHRLKVGRDATVKHIVVTLGGDVVRVTPDAEFVGEGGSVTMLGCTSPTPGSTRSTACSSTTRCPSCVEPGDLQGRAAGRGRAHGVGR